ncbi:putative proline racemase [Dactylonectria estremocensis]|uniref:trans-L-3-hydroxyproline dehydratase n=1 Tax=Dactylonectria estremocensis TaxID=1079267 RepID=A0A9P9END2_9HYPO|nr:putative proline racemase [Dactylonectria estremocensis]
MGSIDRDVKSLDNWIPGHSPIDCIDLHTSGQPARIVIRGFPPLSGTLIEQRLQAREKYDHLRTRIILEPRGHAAMFGCILRPCTESTVTGEAHMGVLFMHNSGFSDMCGHCTFAVARCLVDMHDPSVFPQRKVLCYEEATQTVEIKLHTPTGIVRLVVPTFPGGLRSDPSKPVAFYSVPAFAAALGLRVPIPMEYRWPELGDREDVELDIGYGGAWYGLVKCQDLGFRSGLRNPDLQSLERANQLLAESLSEFLDHEKILPGSVPAGFERFEVRRIMITDEQIVRDVGLGEDQEAGLLFYESQQIDRSPTGGCVVARVAVAYAKGQLRLQEGRSYNSLLSVTHKGEGAFVGTPVKEVSFTDSTGKLSFGVTVMVQGKAYYTGHSTFIVEDEDPLSDGFAFQSTITSG